MHSLIYVGFFRLLPSLDFRAEILFGYSFELLLSLFPMILIQMFNNSDVPGKLTGIQSASLTFKFLALLNLIPELIMMIWELKLNNDYKKLNYKAFQKKPEEERRRLWSKKFGILGAVSFVFFILILIVSLVTSDTRSCHGNHVMELGVCSPCLD